MPHRNVPMREAKEHLPGLVKLVAQGTRLAMPVQFNTAMAPTAQEPLQVSHSGPNLAPVGWSDSLIQVRSQRLHQHGDHLVAAALFRERVPAASVALEGPSAGPGPRCGLDVRCSCSIKWRFAPPPPIIIYSMSLENIVIGAQTSNRRANSWRFHPH